MRSIRSSVHCVSSFEQECPTWHSGRQADPIVLYKQCLALLHCDLHVHGSLICNWLDEELHSEEVHLSSFLDEEELRPSVGLEEKLHPSVGLEGEEEEELRPSIGLVAVRAIRGRF